MTREDDRSPMFTLDRFGGWWFVECVCGFYVTATDAAQAVAVVNEHRHVQAPCAA